MPEVNKVRKLSRFLCQELMYDYAAQELDEGRRLAMENYLKEHPESKKELEATIRAMKYCNQLAQTKLSEPFLQDIRLYKGFIERSIGKFNWRNWPEFIKWGSEAFVISLIVAVVAVLLPWGSFSDFFTTSNQLVTLAEVDRVVPEKQKIEINEAPVKQEPLTEPLSQTKSPEPKSVPQAQPTQPEQPTRQTQKTVTPQPQQGVARKGTLYRAYMDLKDLDHHSADLVNLISLEGGRKAGRVRLGWKKPKGRYFHFSMPEANYESLLNKLRDYGPVRIYKNPHGRIMPEGKIRIILWVEDKGSLQKPKQRSTEPQGKEILPEDSTTEAQ